MANDATHQADTYNIGFMWQPTGTLYFSLDYWRFEFSKPIVQESPQDVLNAASDPTSPAFDLAREKIEFTPQGLVDRITLTYVNGPDTDTDGIDYQLTWDLASAYGLFTFGARGTYINSYEVDGWIWADGYDGVGELNAIRSARPLPQWKNNGYLNWSSARHNVRLDLWHTDGYDDERQPDGSDWSIDEHVTADVNYSLIFNDEHTRLFAAIYNITDEDPPLARLNLSYDPYTHDPLGVVFKVGLQHRFALGPFE